MRFFVFYLFLGLISTQFSWVSLVYLYFLIIQWFLINKNKYDANAFLGVLKICGLEFWGRLTDNHPFFPYELTKYLMFFYLFFYAIFSNNKINKTAILLFVVCIMYSIIAIIVGLKFSKILSDSNGLVILLLGASVLSNSKGIISQRQLVTIAKSWVGFLFMGLIFVFVRTPNIENMSLSLGANYEATGGESANQVSTYLGFGAFLILFLIATKHYFTGYRNIDLILFVLFIFQSLLTFSRGGFLVSLFLILYLLYVLDFLSFDLRKILLFTFLLILVLGAFYYLDNKTNGLLMNRFKGETAATLLGKKEKNLNVVTSNRTQIIEENWGIFKNNFFGVGPSNGTLVRKETFGSNYYDHTEPSRWLVEYGIFGIILFIWLISVLFKYVKFSFPNNASRPYSAFLVAMILFSTLTMLHSATRTFVSFLPMVVGFIKLNPNVAAANRRNKSPQEA